MKFNYKLCVSTKKYFQSILSECINAELHEYHCTKPNKNKCIDNVCKCNTGFVPKYDYCIPCLPNQIVEKDECNGNDVCKNCPVGMHPTIDRLKCIDDEISPFKCTIDGYIVNKNQTDCVKGLYCHAFKQD